MQTNKSVHEDFLPLSDNLLSRCRECGERNSGFRNSKQEKQPNQTVVDSFDSIAQTSEVFFYKHNAAVYETDLFVLSYTTDQN